MSLKRTHADFKQFSRDCANQMGHVFECGSLLEIERSQDDRLALIWAESWQDDDVHKMSLDRDDLLSIALICDFPWIFSSWLRAGYRVNGDALLAFICRDIPGATSDVHVNAFLTDEMRQWNAVLFTYLLSSKPTEHYAIDMYEAGVISFETPIPLSVSEAAGWLWWMNPLEKNIEDASYPLHVALRHRAWTIAERLWDCGADPLSVDPSGKMPFDYLMKNISILGRDHSLKDQLWLQRFKVEEDRAILEDQTHSTTDEIVAPRRL